MNLSFQNIFTSSDTDSTFAIDEATPTATGVFNREIQVQSVAGIDQSIGDPAIYAIAQVTEDFDKVTSITFSLRTGDTAPEGTPAGASTLLIKKTVLLADLVVGEPGDFIFAQALPSGCKKYLWAEWAVTGTNPTAGKVCIALTRSIDSPVSFPSNTGF